MYDRWHILYIHDNCRSLDMFILFHVCIINFVMDTNFNLTHDNLILDRVSIGNLFLSNPNLLYNEYINEVYLNRVYACATIL